MRSRISVNVRSWTTLTAASTVMGWCRIGLRVQMTPTELPDVDMPYLEGGGGRGGRVGGEEEGGWGEGEGERGGGRGGRGEGGGGRGGGEGGEEEGG